jgi:hypothetical protein
MTGRRLSQNARVLRFAREGRWLRQNEWWDRGADGESRPIKALRTRVSELEALGYRFERRWGTDGLREYRLVYMPAEPREVELERASLAAYCFSRPRCVAPGCHRRAIGGEGPGCSRHRAHGRAHSPHGRAHSPESRRKRADALRQFDPVELLCAQCGERFELQGGVARNRPGRFCSARCFRDWLRDERRRGPDAARLLNRLREGLANWREQLTEFKAAHELLDAAEVAESLPR